jgi:hypothetical protein
MLSVRSVENIQEVEINMKHKSFKLNTRISGTLDSYGITARVKPTPEMKRALTRNLRKFEKEMDFADECAGAMGAGSCPSDTDSYLRDHHIVNKAFLETKKKYPSVYKVFRKPTYPKNEHLSRSAGEVTPFGIRDIYGGL